MTTPSLANDDYQATLRSTWVADPADATLLVTAIPTNFPTILTVGWKTIYETVFRVESSSGDNSSNYALTGVTRLKGANANIPEGSAVNCLNNEEYFNQWGDQITAVQEDVAAAEAAATGAQADITDLQSAIGTTGAIVQMQKAVADKVITLTDGVGPVIDAQLGNDFRLVAGGNRTLAAPSGPTDGQKIMIEHTASGAARTLSVNTGTGGFTFGSDVTSIAATASGKTDVIAFKYVTANSINKWLVLAQVQGFS